MDNKYRFVERSKALPKIDPRRDVDPYIFGEPEPFTGANAKSIKSIAPKNPRPSQNGKGGGKSRAKFIKPKIRATQDPAVFANHHGISEPHEINPKRIDVAYQHATGPRHRLTENLKKLKSRRRQSRDHTLLYYPKAGDEISDSDSSGDETMAYQRHWFSGEPNTALSRSARLSQLRSQLRRRLIQLNKGGPESEATLRKKTRCFLEAACRDPASTARALSLDLRGANKLTDGPLLIGAPCGAEGCGQLSLPCTRHCSRHIMMNTDQLLFEHCTAKFSDNTQCCVPVFDVAHELPLCPEHARKRDNYHRKAQESKPKKTRKKPVSPTVPRPKPKSRPKKRKRPPSLPPPPLPPPPLPPSLPPPPPPPIPTQPVSHPSHTPSVPLSTTPPIKLETRNMVDVAPTETTVHHFTSQIIPNENHSKTLNNLNIVQGSSNAANMNLGLGLGSLGLGSGLKVELSDHEVFASLDPTEHDFGNVLNNLPADAFNDLFIENRNGEYEPSREEEEELERALEAVDKDVRNLERMGQTHGLLEPALLAQLMSDIAS